MLLTDRGTRSTRCSPARHRVHFRRNGQDSQRGRCPDRRKFSREGGVRPQPALSPVEMSPSAAEMQLRARTPPIQYSTETSGFGVQCRAMRRLTSIGLVSSALQTAASCFAPVSALVVLASQRHPPGHPQRPVRRREASLARSSQCPVPSSASLSPRSVALAAVQGASVPTPAPPADTWGSRGLRQPPIPTAASQLFVHPTPSPWLRLSCHAAP